MPQVITPPLAGHMLAINPNGGQVKILTGSGDPNAAATDSSAGDIASAAVGSLFLRMDGSTSTTLYVKTATPNTWTAK
jgi:hypothetical protein